ncbi:hypothetical protein V1264_007246 [Littorina saxatilis]|uniref:Uncharacterized protein n=1 Tax=Littorina saxatilis TaxID=31220 RepID=A0AAN9AUF1_9CAEN
MKQKILPVSGDCTKSKQQKQHIFLKKFKKEPGIVESTVGNSHAHCKYCRPKSDFSVAYAGKYDIERHCSSKTHLDKVATKKSAESCQGIIKFIPAKLILPEEKAVVRAEAMFSEIVKMNLPLSTADVISRSSSFHY